MPTRFRLLLITLWTLLGGAALAFCGFYVGRADTELFNESSKVILARFGQRTILTMANDFRGDVTEFALVVPIPYAFSPEQIQVGDPRIFARLDAYSAPRLVEYFDEDPCLDYDYRFNDGVLRSATTPVEEEALRQRAEALGVTIQEAFTVGEYDIIILSAEQSAGLEVWLLENNYNIPRGASEALAPYLEQGMNFFVARVNLEAFESGGYAQLRPLMMAFESPDLMLPIQLGMINADGPQDLVVYVLSNEGRAELVNYPTHRIPSDVNVPEFVEREFGEVYQAIFRTAHARFDGRAALLEYAWDMSWCDPCAADPLSHGELLQAGVFWSVGEVGAPDVFLTRLHVRYTPQSFPEDLVFRLTGDRSNFQARYVMQRPFQGELTCEGGREYARQVQQRRELEARNLVELTGWDLAAVRLRMGEFDPVVRVEPWWQRVFDNLGLR